MDSSSHPAPSLALSFEFFPPNTQEGAVKLTQTASELARLKPEFFSVTYGAGGSTQERTLKTVLQLRESGLCAAPHLSCIGSTKDSLRATLQQYKDQGIDHLVALRGDLPSGTATAGEFHYANELVSFIRHEFGQHFRIEVAAYPEFHPQAKSVLNDLLNFKRKVDAGADSAITQYFYNPDSYFHFINQCEKLGLSIPIFPGIMPIGRFSQLARFSDACGTEIPRWMRKKMEDYNDDIPSIQAFGLDVVTDLCAKLIAHGVPGLHFYTMNQSSLSVEICRRLGLSKDPET
jgi:methylenetetrahydrofolate reductase (NADPH)